MRRFADRHLKTLFTLPVVLFQLLLVVFPVLYTAYTSLFRTTLSSVEPPEFVGLKNYAAVFGERRFWDSVGRTVEFTAVCLVFQLVLGIALALFLHRKFFGKTFVKTAVLMPMVATPVAISVTFVILYDPVFGFLNLVLQRLGLPAQTFLATRETALFSIMFVDIWEWTPMIVLIMLAGLASMPQDPVEAACADGANAAQRLRYIVLPMLAPTILVAATLRLVDLIRTFDIIFSMTAGGPGTATETMNIYGYLYGFQYFEFGTACAILMIFFFVVISVSIVFIRLREKYGRIG